MHWDAGIEKNATNVFVLFLFCFKYCLRCSFLDSKKTTTGLHCRLLASYSMVTWWLVFNSIQLKKSLLTVKRDMNVTIIQIQVHQSPNPNGLILYSEHIIWNRAHSSNIPIKLFNYVISFFLSNMLPMWILKAVFVCASL